MPQNPAPCPCPSRHSLSGSELATEKSQAWLTRLPPPFRSVGIGSQGCHPARPARPAGSTPRCRLHGSPLSASCGAKPPDVKARCSRLLPYTVWTRRTGNRRSTAGHTDDLSFQNARGRHRHWLRNYRIWVGGFLIWTPNRSACRCRLSASMMSEACLRGARPMTPDGHAVKDFTSAMLQTFR